MEVPDALAWTAPLVVGLVVWWATSFAVGMLAMLLASALVWFVFEYEP
jgi:hypothetical protein